MAYYLTYQPLRLPQGDATGATILLGEESGPRVFDPDNLVLRGDRADGASLVILTDDEGADRWNRPKLRAAQLLTIVPNPQLPHKSFYFFGATLTATSFVLPDKTLTETSFSGFGSGIYGYYIENSATLARYLSSPTDKYQVVECQNPFVLLDKAHGESLSVASLQTNRYLDRLLPVRSSLTPRQLIEINPWRYLHTLWNITLGRVGAKITGSRLLDILQNYLGTYKESSLRDTRLQVPIQRLPINDILGGLGYDGIMSQSPSNNTWLRSCLKFDFTVPVLEGTTSKTGSLIN